MIITHLAEAENPVRLGTATYTFPKPGFPILRHEFSVRLAG